MYRKEVNESSPLRILERSIHGGLGPGNLGVIMSRAGAGKTAFMVQLGLDDVMRERDVLHVSLHHSVDHVLSWYDALFDDLAKHTRLEDREMVRARIAKHRVIQSYPDARITPQRLESVIDLYNKHADFKPSVIMIDGFRWDEPTDILRAADLGGFQAAARRYGAELWMTVQTHRSVTSKHPMRLTAPVDTFADMIDVAVFLEPEDDHYKVRLLKDHDEPAPVDTHLELCCDTLRLVTDEERKRELALPNQAYTCLTGGAAGSEATFGACAERWGLHEQTFSFEGRKVERDRGLVLLTDEELHAGSVSDAYLKAQLHRSFPSTPQFRRMLQTIWHQVATAGEVFVVGTIQDDDTVKGGTGWAAELARHLNKPVFVFDQVKDHWVTTKGDRWVKTQPPTITHTRFTGTGTRHLEANGKAAIEALLERSFGAES